MDASVVSRPPARAVSRGERGRVRRRGAGPWLVGLALLVGALTLLLPWALAFDPLMWVVWGRDITRWSLDTRGGPSWKPLPALFTTPFALFGGAAPALWLVVARAGALMALTGAWALGRRLAGPWAGATAAGVLALSTWWLPNAALGNSEALLAAAVPWAWLAHLDGRRRTAVGLAIAAALLRPEAWPFLGLYGLWLWRADPRTRVLLAAGAVAVPALWIVPSALGGSGAFGASSVATEGASPGSAVLADVPWLAVWGDAVAVLGLPALACAAALALPRIRGPRGSGAGDGGVLLTLALSAVGWVAIVSAMTAAGYPGNPRYLAAAAAAGSVLAGVGAVRLAAALRVPPPAALVVALAVGLIAAAGLVDWIREVGVRSERRAALPAAIAAAGGRDALVRCAPPRTVRPARSLVVWELDVPALGVDDPPRGPAVVVQMKPYGGGALEPPADAGTYGLRARNAGWAVRAACRSDGG
jgi:hypothetical protein